MHFGAGDLLLGVAVFSLGWWAANQNVTRQALITLLSASPPQPPPQLPQLPPPRVDDSEGGEDRCDLLVVDGTSMSPEAFAELSITHNRPILLRGLGAGWDAWRWLSDDAASVEPSSPLNRARFALRYAALRPAPSFAPTPGTIQCGSAAGLYCCVRPSCSTAVVARSKAHGLTKVRCRQSCCTMTARQESCTMSAHMDSDSWTCTSIPRLRQDWARPALPTASALCLRAGGESACRAWVDPPIAVQPNNYLSLDQLSGMPALVYCEYPESRHLAPTFITQCHYSGYSRHLRAARKPTQ